MAFPQTKQDWAVMPYNTVKIRDRYLATTHWGGWTSLDTDEFRKLNSLLLEPGTPLFDRLKKNRLIINKRDIDKLSDQYRKLHANFFHDAGLHIAVVTNRCNFACSYCQGRNSAGNKYMDIKVATKVLGC